MTEAEFQWTIRQERKKGKDAVSAQLDDLCLHFGFDPYTTWRRPRFEQRWSKATEGFRQMGQAVKKAAAAFREVGPR